MEDLLWYGTKLGLVKGYTFRGSRIVSVQHIFGIWQEPYMDIAELAEAE